MQKQKRQDKQIQKIFKQSSEKVEEKQTLLVECGSETLERRSKSALTKQFKSFRIELHNRKGTESVSMLQPRPEHGTNRAGDTQRS